MTDEPDSLVLQQLRAIRADTAAIRKTLSDHSHRLSALTGQVAQLRSAGGGDAALAAMNSGRVDTIEDRLARIEGQLGIAD